MDIFEAQKLWDRHLIASFFTFHKKCGIIVVQFMEKYPDIDMTKLLRVPPRKLCHLSINIFISKYLPRLARVLGATTEDDVIRRAKILVKLSKSSMTCEEKGYTTVDEARENRECQVTLNKYRAGCVGVALYSRRYTSNKLSSQWKVCK